METIIIKPNIPIKKFRLFNPLAFFVTIILFLSIRALWTHSEQWAQENIFIIVNKLRWHTVQGEIQKTTVKEKGTRCTRKHGCLSISEYVIQYQYSYDGNDYRGEEVGKTDIPIPSFKGYPSGKKIQVYVNPDNPSDSFILHGKGIFFILLVTVVTFLLIWFYILYFTWHILNRVWCTRLPEDCDENIQGSPDPIIELSKPKYWTMLCKAHPRTKQYKISLTQDSLTCDYGTNFMLSVFVKLFFSPTLFFCSLLAHLPLSMIIISCLIIFVYYGYCLNTEIVPKHSLFDKKTKTYKEAGGKYSHGAEDKSLQEVFQFSKIYAVQLLEARRFDGVKKGYEVNLLTYNDEKKRVHEDYFFYKRHFILSSKNFSYMKEAAIQISAFLDIPVVTGEYWNNEW